MDGLKNVLLKNPLGGNKIKFIITSDLHLTNRPRDEYRWEIFPFLKKQIQLRGVGAVFILGDITDSKDHHPNDFINRVVDNLREVAELCPVLMLAGNHDSINPTVPLLRFLNSSPIRFFCQPESIELGGYTILMMPNQKHQVTLTKLLNQYKADEHDFVLLHQTFSGSLAANGVALQGIDPDSLKSLSTKYISGDVHVPQQIGRVIYCGSPHPIHFGDTFKPRVLFWDGNDLTSIPRTTTKKMVLEINDPSDLEKIDELDVNDQVKVILTLPKDRYGEWEEARVSIEEAAKNKGWILSSIELQSSEGNPKLKGRPTIVTKPNEVYENFCSLNLISPQLTKFGGRILNDSLGI